MNSTIRRIRIYCIVLLSLILLACGGEGSGASENGYPASYTGIDCFGSNANASNTQEESGVALFFASFYPSVVLPGKGNAVNAIWSTIVSNLSGSTPATPLILSATGDFNLESCSRKYGEITAHVMNLDRNNFGTDNQGTAASYDDLKTKIATSTADFVGLDGFYFAAQSLGMAPPNQIQSNFSQGQFFAALTSVCPDGGHGPSGEKIRQLGGCANATYMNSFLWKEQGSGGLFSSSGSSGPRFEGVVSNDVGETAALTWTRGYLLLKYAAAQAATTYTMIFDAGSSGTRVNFYKVVGGDGGYPQVTLLANKKSGDNGINDFLDNKGSISTSMWTAGPSTGFPVGYSPEGCNMTASSSNGNKDDVGPCVVQPLLDSMAGAMSLAGVSAGEVKVEVFATAGMRTMSTFNGGRYTDLEITDFYQTMRDYTNITKGFPVGVFQTSNGNSQEGVWTWVNLVDQYYNAFGGNATYYTGASTTRGDFEVGGSSMQVAFPTSLALGNDNVYNVTINGRSYNVFSKTYLGLGQDDARKFMRSFGY